MLFYPHGWHTDPRSIQHYFEVTPGHFNAVSDWLTPIILISLRTLGHSE